MTVRWIFLPYVPKIQRLPCSLTLVTLPVSQTIRFPQNFLQSSDSGTSIDDLSLAETSTEAATPLTTPSSFDESFLEDSWAPLPSPGQDLDDVNLVDVQPVDIDGNALNPVAFEFGPDAVESNAPVSIGSNLDPQDDLLDGKIISFGPADGDNIDPLLTDPRNSVTSFPGLADATEPDALASLDAVEDSPLDTYTRHYRCQSCRRCQHLEQCTGCWKLPGFIRQPVRPGCCRYNRFVHLARFASSGSGRSRASGSA